MAGPHPCLFRQLSAQPKSKDNLAFGGCTIAEQGQTSQSHLVLIRASDPVGWGSRG